MRKPNFFIIGVPKCGTTSLAAWLAEHPDIYMSPWKEPRYFDRDLKTRARITPDAYRALFAGVTDQHKAVGEATVWYLYSQEAVAAIERELPGAHYIVMVRNPVEMARALHEQLLLNGAEHVRDFERAWRLSPLRREGKKFRPWFVSDGRLLDYQSLCRLGEQLERLLQVVPRERVLVCLLDDLRENPRREYLRLLGFLNVPDDGRTVFKVKNPAKRIRSQVLQELIVSGMKVERVIKERLGLAPVTSPFLRRLNIWNKVARPRPPLPDDLRRELETYFAPDIQKIERILNRDLSHWVKSGQVL